MDTENFHKFVRLFLCHCTGCVDIPVHKADQLFGSNRFVSVAFHFLFPTKNRFGSFFFAATNGLIPKAIKFCFSGFDFDYIDSSHLPKTTGNNTAVEDCVLVCYCFVGLMGSYLTWGLLQERIMTQSYVNAEGKHKHFKDSQFLVFANRALAFCIAAGFLIVKKQSRHRAPLYKYSYASLSNIMSTWFQYEALKFVSFPTQVLAKSVSQRTFSQSDDRAK